MLAFAQQLSDVETFIRSVGRVETFIKSIGRLVDVALPVVVAIALLGFLWGLVKFIFAQGNEEAKVDAKKIMFWAFVALFVMVSVWGLVGFLGDAMMGTPLA